jgi:hypothetical protein
MAYFRTFSPVVDGSETALIDDATGVEIFRYNHVQLSMMLTPEEAHNASTLCLQARIRGGWRGDIFKPVEYDICNPEEYNVTKANND